MTGPPDATSLLLDIPEADRVLESVGRLSLPGATVLRPAHVSLAHPWLEPAAALASIERVDDVLARTPPIPIRFRAVARFGLDRRSRVVVHLELEAPEPVRSLAQELGLPLPAPHLSVVRLPAAEEAALQVAERSIGSALPLDAVVRTAQVRVRHGSWWRVEHVAHLGGGL